MENKKDISNYIFIGIIIMALIFFVLVIIFNRKIYKNVIIKPINTSQDHSQIHSQNHSQNKSNENTNNIVNSFMEVISSQNIPTIIL